MQYGLIGEKLGHSFSKTIHEHIADYTYDLTEISKEELDSFMRSADFCGINVTIPYKQAVIPYLDSVDEAAKAIGAVNTVVSRGGKLFGYNTDFGGMKKLLIKNGFELCGKKVLILGTGGTSKTAEAVCRSLGAKEIHKVGRTNDINYGNVKKLHFDADFIINTTPLGMYPNAGKAAITLDGFSSLQGVADVVYNPLKTQIVSEAEKRGIKCCGGLYMLVSQAVLACEIFLNTHFADEIYDEVYNHILYSKQNIVLTGMPGSGKTTVGKLLSEITGKAFIDTDEMIKTEQNTEISDIFSRFGEEHFRRLETEAVKRASQNNGIIIATGGGAVLKEENVDSLKSNGKIFFLNRPLDNIVPTDDRPLSNSREQLEKRFSERYPVYKATCDEEILSLGAADETARLILEKMK